MNSPKIKILVLILTVLHFSTSSAQKDKSLTAARAKKYPELSKEILRQEITIWSDGTRMAGDIYKPKDIKPEDKLPAIVFVHGTGGTKKGVPARMAPMFVKAGYIFLTFDYRGWGESDSKLLMLEPMPVPDKKGEVKVRARAIRWQMDFADQTADIRCAIAFISGENNVDPARIGILGTSYGGGLVTWMAAYDPLVKAAVAQVPGMGGGRGKRAEKRAFGLLVKQTRGEVEPIPFEHGAPGGKMSSYAHMRYNTAKGIGFNAIKAAESIKIPMLIIDAENEELMDTGKNGKRVADILKANGTPVTYFVMKGIDHYGIYREKFKEATKMEIAWFNKQFKGEQ